MTKARLSDSEFGGRVQFALAIDALIRVDLLQVVRHLVNCVRRDFALREALFRAIHCVIDVSVHEDVDTERLVQEHGVTLACLWPPCKSLLFTLHLQLCIGATPHLWSTIVSNLCLGWTWAEDVNLVLQARV